MTRGPIEGIGPEDDGETPGVKSWDRYLRHAEEMAASEAAAKAAAEAEARAAAQPPPVERTDRPQDGKIASAVVTAAGAAAAGLRSALKETPEQKRMDLMAAMQAEALAHLEIAPHADAVAAAQRASDNSDPGALLAGKVLSETRRLEGDETDPEAKAARKPDAPRPAPKYVAPTKKLEGRAPGAKRDRRDQE